MSWQQIAMIVYFVLYLVCGMIVNGHDRTGKYSFVDVFITCALHFIILYTGGFWDK